MDLFREIFDDRKNYGELAPRSPSKRCEGFLSPQGNAPTDSPIKLCKSLTEGSSEDFEESQVWRGEVVEGLILKLWVEDLPGKEHAESYLIDQYPGWPL